MSLQVTKTDYLENKMLFVSDTEEPDRFLLIEEKQFGCKVLRLFEREKPVLVIKQSFFMRNHFKCKIPKRTFTVVGLNTTDGVYAVKGKRLQLIQSDTAMYKITNGKEKLQIHVKETGASTHCLFDDLDDNRYLISIALVLCSFLG